MPGTTPSRATGTTARIRRLRHARLELSQRSVKLEVRSLVAAGDWVVTECVGHGVTRRARL